MMRLLILFPFLLSASFAQLAPPALTPVEKLKLPDTSEEQKNPDQPQFVSLSGNSLFGLRDEKGEIAAKQKAVEENPNEANAYIALGLMQDSYLRHAEAIQTYTQGAERFPQDWRFLRYRGQRLITARKFEEAIRDLEAAREKTKKSFDVAYYLGLAYYFKGEFEKAAGELGRCESQMKAPLPGEEDLRGLKSCEDAREDQSYQVPLMFWRYLALRRAGQLDQAKAYAEAVSPLWTLSANKAFYEALLYFRGTKDLSDMMEGSNEATRDYLIRSTGVAAHLFVEGERQKACAIWQRNSLDVKWNHLGVIAAESEFYRNSRAACALYGLGDKPAPPPAAQN